jgi:starch synthase
MNILYAVSEAAPFALTGRLGDVAGALPAAIRHRGHACRVALPLYDTIGEPWRRQMKLIASFQVELGWRSQYCGVYRLSRDGVIYYFLDNEYYFKRGRLYGEYDDGERFAYFCAAVLTMLPHIDFYPQVLHVNDWQTASIPLLLRHFFRGRQGYGNIMTVMTIHNIQYQGVYDLGIAGDLFGLPSAQWHRLAYNGCANLLAGGIREADIVNTVSPTYAMEITDEPQSFGLGGLLRENAHKLAGILNGIDTRVYDPATDPLLYARYSVAELEPRGTNKRRLMEELKLDPQGNPMLLGVVSRLTARKGMDLLIGILDRLVSEGFLVAAVGTGDKVYEDFLLYAKQRYPGRVAAEIGFLPQFARYIYAGADAFLMPSLSEPCGLAQMLALRYGAIPIVRLTGGLRDTVVDLDDPGGNGFTFFEATQEEFLRAIHRARALYDNPQEWAKAVKNALSQNFSWSRSAAEYIELYRKLQPSSC